MTIIEKYQKYVKKDFNRTYTKDDRQTLEYDTAQRNTIERTHDCSGGVGVNTAAA